MSANGGKADVRELPAVCPLIAEVVEKVPGSRILETVIQSGDCDRINIAQRAADRNDRCGNSSGSDFFNTLGYKRTYSGHLANVCFTPNSGHKWLCCGMSAYDPKRTLENLRGFPYSCQSFEIWRV
jgi:hypothetical protein